MKEARRLRYLTATTVRVSAFVNDLQNSQEITHDLNLVGSEAETDAFLRTMAGLGDFIQVSGR